jgi:transketolase
MRNEYINNLISELKINKSVRLIVGDLGYSVIEPLQDSHPNAFINAGVAEQNMAGLAAGLASEGDTVFTYSICNFPTFRCAEQIRNDIDYNNLPVITTSVGSGVGYGSLGYSHHAVQDIGLMRLFPNTLIACPSDIEDLNISMSYFFNNKTPGYLRLPKATPIKLPEITFSEDNKPYEVGNLVKKLKGNPCHAVISLGSVSFEASSFALEQEASLFSIPLWGPKVTRKVYDQIKNFKYITVFEDHLFQGGLSSYLIEILHRYSDSMPKLDFYCFHQDVVGSVGEEEYLKNKYFRKI